MIEPTDEMGAALLRGLPADMRWGWMAEDAKTWLSGVLAIVERDHLTQPTCTCTGSGWPHVPSSARCTPPPVLQAEHKPERPGSDGLGYGRCPACGELWPCTASRAMVNQPNGANHG